MRPENPSPDRVVATDATIHETYEPRGRQQGHLLFDVPHGATSRAHWDAVRGRLAGSYPENLVDFYFVNTDLGAPEIARSAAARLAAEGWTVELLVGIVPRTFVDLNRALTVASDSYRTSGLTPSVPSYVEHEADRALLTELHREHQEATDRLFSDVCGGGGVAVALHTYAPRSIQLHDIDRGIVPALHEAYQPGTVEKWPLRPEVDLITATPDGEVLADPDLVQALDRELSAEGFAVEANSTYQLIPGTMAAERSLRWPRHVLCLEFRRDLLVDEWIPFRELAPGPGVERAARGLTRALLAS